MSKKTTLLFCFILAEISACFAQHQTGFYLVVESKNNCTHWVKSFDRKNNFCITEKPIIGETEFESVSGIQYDQAKQTKLVNLKLTKNGFTTIKTISKLPNCKLLFVVADRGVGIFNGFDQRVGQTIPISGSLISMEIDWVVEKLTPLNKK